MRRSDGLVVAICAAALAVLLLAGPAHAATYSNGFQMSRFKVEVKGVQTTVQQYTKEAVDECDFDDHSSGSEKVVFRTTKPVYLTAMHMKGERNPEFFGGKQLSIPTKAVVKRSYTPRISRAAKACEDNGGGVANETKPDCGTKVVQPFEVRLQYAREKKDALLLSSASDAHPYEECPSGGGYGMSFPSLLLENSGARGNYIYADLSQDELFDPKFQKWISIARGSRKEVDESHWVKTEIEWDVSFTRLKDKH